MYNSFMMNFRTLYFHSEQQIRRAIIALFCLLAFFIFIQTIFSASLALVLLISIIVVIVTFLRPLYTLGFIAAYLPFESFILKFIPDNIYIFARYFSEGLIYLVAFVVITKLLKGEIRLKKTALDVPFILFVISLLAATAIHFVPLPIALLGLRQILRFILVFFLVVYLQPSKSFVKKLTIILFAIVLFQAGLGIVQSFLGETLDQFLLPSDRKTFGEITLTEGVEQFWDPGSRVFSTLGRYDRLGNFLYFFLILASGFFFTMTKRANKIPQIILWIFALGIPALVLTYSRASWFAFLIGFLYIGLIIKRDKKVLAGLLVSIFIVLSYLAVSGLTVRYLADIPGQTLPERFFETFSYTRWRGEYYGLGRVFWYVHTPTTVVAASPILGWGPGQFGGGAVAALHNTRVYDQLGLPFGVFGTGGFIDNNWFSLWAEAGTLGIFFFVWMHVALFRHALSVYHSSDDEYKKSLAIGFAAVMLAVAFNAFTSTIFEIRTLAFYLWLYGGIVYCNNGSRGL